MDWFVCVASVPAGVRHLRSSIHAMTGLEMLGTQASKAPLSYYVDFDLNILISDPKSQQEFSKNGINTTTVVNVGIGPPLGGWGRKF